MGINTFRDDQLERGEEINPKLLKTIEESRISIVVFSKDYAHSKWCLDELAKIMEELREAFSIHERNVDEKKVQRWKDSLTEASNLSGFHVNDGSDLHDIRVVGIYGTGGIGKTTIAKIVYNEIQYQFTGASFLQDVRETFNKRGQLQQQKQLLHDTVGYDEEFSNINKGINIIKAGLSLKRFLLVGGGSPKWFGPGSTIIITTRNQHMLVKYGVTISYKATGLHYWEALQLFSQHAFKQNVPKAGYFDLSDRLVQYAQGLPLALKVLGSSLRGMTIEQWESALNKLKKNPNKEINDVLRISFDGLDNSQKEVFLDIACFFKGEREDFVSRILDGCNLHPIINIKDLCDRCLITILHNVIQMHDLIQEMGWAIVREECPGDPHKWSRLWDVDDIYNAFSRKELVKMPKFSSMPNLERLNLEGCTSLRELHSSIGDLKWLTYLNVGGCEQLQSLPNSMKFESLEVLYLNQCRKLKKIPKIHGNMGHLKELYFNGSGIKGLPDSIGNSEDKRNMKCLKSLSLDETAIKELPNSIGSLTSLKFLSLRKCSKFEKFSDVFTNMRHLWILDLRESGIKELPGSIGCLESLLSLDLSNCSNFERLPEIQKIWEIYRLPCSIVHLTRLDKLHLANCRNLTSLPNLCGLKSIECLSIYGCSNLEAFSEITEDMKRLECLSSSFLELNNCENLVALPNSIGSLTRLTSLCVRKCTKLHLPDNLRGLRHCLKKLDLGGCNLMEEKSPVFVIPGSSGIPEWVRYQRMGCEVSIELPMNWYEDNNFLGFVLFFHHVPLDDDDDDDECETTESEFPHCELTISHGDQSERLKEISGSSYPDELDCYNSGSTSDPAIWVTYFLRLKFPCGIHLLYAQDQMHCPQPSRGSLGDREDHPA
ncbi:hypothetical protein AAG906_000392 [Vitis piasezkii]